MPNKRILIYDHRGVMSGDIRDNGMFHKRVDGSKHFLCRPPAITIETVIIEQLQKNNASSIVVEDRETGKTYHSTLENFITHSVEYDRGYGRQRWLLFQYWNIQGKKDSEPQKSEYEKEQKRSEEKAKQPTLFD